MWRSTMKIIIFMCNSLSSYKTVLDARQTILLSRRFNMGRRRHVHLEMWRWSTQSGGEEHGQNIVIQSTDRVPVEMAATTRQQQAQTEMLVEGHSE